MTRHAWLLGLLFLVVACVTAPPFGGAFDAGETADADAIGDVGVDGVQPDLDAGEGDVLADIVKDDDVLSDWIPEALDVEVDLELDACDPPVCEELAPSSPCYFFRFDEATCRCVEEQRATKAPCDDGFACTLEDFCLGNGNCIGAPVGERCDDQNECTFEACDLIQGCIVEHAELGAPCNADGTECTMDDACQPRVRGRVRPGGRRL